MELTDLRYFWNVAHTLSFARGAALSHVSPAAISQAIKKLEGELGTRLFARTTRRVALTESGVLGDSHWGYRYAIPIVLAGMLSPAMFRGLSIFANFTERQRAAGLQSS